MYIPVLAPNFRLFKSSNDYETKTESWSYNCLLLAYLLLPVLSSKYHTVQKSWATQSFLYSLLEKMVQKSLKVNDWNN